MCIYRIVVVAYKVWNIARILPDYNERDRYNLETKNRRRDRNKNDLNIIIYPYVLYSNTIGRTISDVDNEKLNLPYGLCAKRHLCTGDCICCLYILLRFY